MRNRAKQSAAWDFLFLEQSSSATTKLSDVIVVCHYLLSSREGVNALPTRIELKER
jgi:hypothetical protein